MSAPQVKAAELARLCALGAGDALNQLLGGTLQLESPRCWAAPGGRIPPGIFAREERVAAVLAELEGSLTGLSGLLLERTALRQVVLRLTGDTQVNTLSERALSALCEVGNIAVSAAANVISAQLGGVVLPSVPRLGFEKPAESALVDLCGDLGERTAHLVETGLRGPEGALRLVFVLVPE